ncbi:hypothetical protein [Nocardia sp. NPDC005978]|uniref:hypothetical protein n=1 Tax=unclassified Nocardia TaxID=2637762 RepID=UPI0033A937F9
MSDDTSILIRPRIREALIAAADALADGVRARILHSPRPVFMYYVAQTFDSTRTTLARGLDPYPATPAQQLCLHLMCAYVERYRDAVDYDIARLRAELLSDGQHEVLARLGRGSGNQPETYDFAALGDVLSGSGMSAFFAPLEPDSLVA